MPPKRKSKATNPKSGPSAGRSLEKASPHQSDGSDRSKIKTSETGPEEEGNSPKRRKSHAKNDTAAIQPDKLSSCATSTPPSEGQRRSGRERKPNSMLKGMEVQITPTRSRKHAHKTDAEVVKGQPKGSNSTITPKQATTQSLKSAVVSEDKNTNAICTQKPSLIKTTKNQTSKKTRPSNADLKDEQRQTSVPAAARISSAIVPTRPPKLESSDQANPMNEKSSLKIEIRLPSPKEKDDDTIPANGNQEQHVSPKPLNKPHVDSHKPHQGHHGHNKTDSQPRPVLTRDTCSSEDSLPEHNQNDNLTPDSQLQDQEKMTEEIASQSSSSVIQKCTSVPSLKNPSCLNITTQAEGSVITSCVELQQVSEVPIQEKATKTPDPAPSQMTEVVLMDLDTGEQKLVGSMVGEKAKVAQEQSVESVPGTKQVSQSKESQGKDMEDEMMSLLNLFLNNVSDKKDEDKTEHGKKEVSVVVSSNHNDPNCPDVSSEHLQVESDEPSSISIVLSQDPSKVPMMGDQPCVVQQHGLEQSQSEVQMQVSLEQSQSEVQMQVGLEQSQSEVQMQVGLEQSQSEVQMQVGLEQSQSEVQMQVVYLDESSSEEPVGTTKDSLKILSSQELLNDSNLASHAEVEDNGSQQLRIMIHSSGVNPSSNMMSKPRYKDDLLQMSDDGRFCCKKCSYSTDKKGNWYKHKIKHRARQYQCHHCKYMAATSSNMKRHLLVHEGVRKYQCEQCGAKFNQKIHLTRHIKYKHEERKVQCTYCDYICASIQPDLVMHMKRKHADLCNVDKQGNIQGNNAGSLDMIMKFKCDQCNLYTVSRKDLLQHMKFHKKGSELKFFCELCSFVTESESRLKRHILTHTKEKPFSCGICDYKANEAEHVKRHLRKKHKIDIPSKSRKVSNKPSDPEAGSSSESFLIDKSYIHRPKYPLSDTRNSEKHFACNFCTMKFTKLINLFKHVHVQHKQMMPYESVYSCVVCDYTTTYYKRLLIHMRKMHSTTNCMNTPQKQVYVCMLCNYSSPYRLYLHAHLKKEHNMQMVSDKEGVNKYMLDASKHSSMVVQAIEESDTPKPGSIIKQTSASLSAEENSADAPSKDSKMVLVQLTPDGPMTPVFISMGETDPNSSSSLLSSSDPVNEYPIMETGIMDNTPLGIESCEDHDLGQVLKGVTVTPPPVATVSSSSSSPPKPIIDLPQLLSQPTVTVCQQEVENNPDNLMQVKREPGTSQSNTDPSHSDPESDSTDEGKTQIDSDQVVHLSSGDFVEINGQIYKIEMEDDNEQAKQ